VNPVLLHREWLIQPDALHSMAASLRGIAASFTAQPPADPPHPLLSIEDGIGVVSIEGPILRKPDVFARVFMGATSSEDIGDALRQAGERPDIKAVFLDIDSPGGTVAGTPELAAAVAALDKKKPVYAFSSGLMCSAAYWVASQARAIYATPSAQVGSIGVVQAVVDHSAAIEKAGIKVEVFSVGRYKAMGAPGTPLTDEQRELISSNLAEIAGEFHAAVLARGRAIPAEAMEGQTFSGRQAQRHNLAGMVADRAEAMRRLRAYHSASVDSGSRAMNTAIEDELAKARADLLALQADHQAQTELLTEESTTATSLRGEVELLTAEIESLRAERDDARTASAGLITERDHAAAEASTLRTRVTELQASQADFDKRLQLEVARVVASTGTTMPARVTPAGDAPQAAELHTQFAAITDPAAQTAFWRKLTPEQQALILNHQA
jgi:signal peptide peptidase SppA